MQGLLYFNTTSLTFSEIFSYAGQASSSPEDFHWLTTMMFFSLCRTISIFQILLLFDSMRSLAVGSYFRTHKNLNVPSQRVFCKTRRTPVDLISPQGIMQVFDMTHKKTDIHFLTDAYQYFYWNSVLNSENSSERSSEYSLTYKRN